MKRLYKVWKIVHEPLRGKGPHPSWIEPGDGYYAYPLVEVISVLSSRYSRDDLVSIDLDRLQEFVKYLNEMADDNEHYEVREVDPKEYEHLL